VVLHGAPGAIGLNPADGVVLWEHAWEPDGFKELARFPALDDRTWNLPVLVRDTLLVRNGGEMVAFRLPMHKR